MTVIDQPHTPCSGSVILVNNLPDTKISPDVLFTLFGVYGDVMRVKILFNKRDSAMIQYAQPQQVRGRCGCACT